MCIWAWMIIPCSLTPITAKTQRSFAAATMWTEHLQDWSSIMTGLLVRFDEVDTIVEIPPFVYNKPPQAVANKTANEFWRMISGVEEPSCSELQSDMLKCICTHTVDGAVNSAVQWEDFEKRAFEICLDWFRGTANVAYRDMLHQNPFDQEFPLVTAYFFMGGTLPLFCLFCFEVAFCACGLVCSKTVLLTIRNKTSL